MSIFRRAQAVNRAPLFVAQGTVNPGEYTRTLKHGNLDRWYAVHVPPCEAPPSGWPVVMNWHGGGGNPDQQRNDSKMDDVADQHGFLVVYPAGTGIARERLLTFNAGICCGYAREHGIDDVGFAEAVLTDLAGYFPLDTRRIFSTGFSNGGFMTYRLACERPKLFAAIACVAGVLGVDPRDHGSPVPLIHFHGLQDQNVAFAGGIGPRAIEKVPRRSVPDTIRLWTERNVCEPKPAREQRVGAAVLKVFSPIGGGAPVEWWTLEDGGHTWPGGASTLPESFVGSINRDISASELQWDFFTRSVRST